MASLARVRPTASREPTVAPASHGVVEGTSRSTTPEPLSANWARARRAVKEEVSRVRAAAAQAKGSTWDVTYQKLTRMRPAVQSSEAERFINEIVGARRPGSSAQIEVSAGKGKGKAAKDAPVSTHLAALQQLGTILERFRHVGSLPNSTIVLSELSRPFLAVSIDIEACNFALNLFQTVCLYYRSISADEELARWTWCCRVAEVEHSQLRNRALLQLISLMQPLPGSAVNARPETPLALQAFAGSLIRALHAATKTLDHGDEIQKQHFETLSKLLGRLAGGEIIQPLPTHEAEYAIRGRQMSRTDIARLAYLEGLVRVIVAGPKALSEFVVLRLLNNAWLSPPLMPPAIQLRLLKQLGAAFSSLLSGCTKEQGGVLFGRLLDSALITAVCDFLRGHFRMAILQSLPMEAQQAVFACYFSVLEALSVEQYSNRHWPPSPQIEMPSHVIDVREVLQAAWTAGMQDSLTNAAVELVDREASRSALGFLCLAMQPDICTALAQRCLPAFMKHLATHTSPMSSTAAIVDLLHTLASQHTQLFYKPLFTVAASNKPDGVRHGLVLLRKLAGYMNPLRFYMRDPEMMAVALLSNPAPPKSSGKVNWSDLRLGQQAVLAELIVCIRDLRTDTLTVSDAREVRSFADGFETRMERFLASREQSSLLSLRDRMLISSLLLELQLVSASQKKPAWFDRAVRWTLATHVGAEVALDAKPQSNPFLHDDRPYIVLSEEDGSEARATLRSLALVLAVDSLPARNHSVNGLLAHSLATHVEKTQGAKHAVSGLAEGDLAAPFVSLLAALYPGLNDEDLTNLSVMIWQHHLFETDGPVFVSSSFLIMQAGDRVPAALRGVVEADLRHVDAEVRYMTIRKLVNLFVGRFKVSSQPLPEKLRRRPFRAGRQQIGFVPTNMGLSTYVAPTLIEPTKATVAASLPTEIRKALTELGWDQEASQQTASERERLPLRALTLSEIAHQTSQDRPISIDGSASPLLHSKSLGSSVNQSSTSRPVLVGAVAAMMARLTLLLSDEDVRVANNASEALQLFMRDEPILLMRPMLESLSGSADEQSTVVSVLSRLVLLDEQLPPGFISEAFNHLAGLVRTVSREGEDHTALAVMARSMPITCDLAPLTPDMSMREIRKNKAESNFLPTGQLWFGESDPIAVGFPRSYLGDTPVFDRLDMPASVFAVITTRIAQNRFLASLMDKGLDPEAFFRIKQGLKPLALPISDNPRSLVDSDFLPRVLAPNQSLKTSRRQQDFTAFSRLVARAHLQMTLTLIGGLSRHLSDRSELARVFDGPCRALLAHGTSDLDIAMLGISCCLLASIRFRRLFSSAGGFSTFVPALFKVYCDTEVPAIKVAIESAWVAFYARHEHQESFVFQSLSILSSIIATPDVPAAAADITRAKLFDLLQCLDAGPIGNVADLLAGTMEQAEREAAIHRFNDAPESVLAPLLKKNGQEAPKPVALASVKLRFPLEDTVRLCITAITFEPASKRALNFLRLFRLLTPRFLEHSSSTRALVRDGVEALVNVFVKSSPPVKTKALGGIVTEAPAPLDAAQQMAWVSAREAYLFLCEAYLGAGGELAAPSMRKVLEMLRSMLRSAGSSLHNAASAVVHKISQVILGAHSPVKTVNGFLQDFAPVFRDFAQVVAFAPFLEGLGELVGQVGRTMSGEVVDVLIEEYLKPATDMIVSAATSSATLISLKDATVKMMGSIALAGFDDALSPLEVQKSSSVLLARLVLPLVEHIAWAQADQLSPLKYQRQRGRLLLRLATLIVKMIKENQSSVVLLLSCQSLKAIALSSEDELSAVIGAWPFLANAFRACLATGGTKFLGAFPSSQPGSRPHSPSGRHGRATSLDERVSMPSPRAADYAFWSLAELVALSSSPLVIHLRSMLREKIVEARSFADAVKQFRHSERQSFAPGSPLLNRSNSRGKAGQRPNTASSAQSASSTTSPRRPASFAFYDRAYRPIEPSSAPSSPSPATTAFPRIQHLGLANPPKTLGSDEKQALTSPALVRLTLGRIRKVQILLGEAPITHSMAMPDEGEDEDEGLHAWTRHEAMKRIDDETALLLAELT